MISSRINVSSILRDHLQTLKSEPENRLLKPEAFCFFIVPIFLSLAVLWFGWRMSDGVVNLTITVFSILAGFLINLLVLLYSIAQKKAADQGSSTEPDGHPLSDAQQALSETVQQSLANIAFAILLSVLIVIVLIFASSFDDAGAARLYVTSLIIFLATHFIVTFMMILKRIYILIDIQI
ncbi:MAG: hypothetical protein ING06_11050 [Roseomonas sp.]|nr:hypothetical protein [Roseomonas sp.]